VEHAADTAPRTGIGWRGAAALAAGGLLALAPERLRGSGAPVPSGSARWVVADRDGGELVLLDEDLLVVERRELPWPTHVRAGPDGGLWAVSARDGHPDGVHELVRMDAAGALDVLHTLPPVLDLEVDDAGRAWLLVRPRAGGAEVVVTGGRAWPARFPAPHDARALVLDGERTALVSPRSGLLALEPASGCWERVAGPDEGELLDAAPADDAGWWLLVRAGPTGEERLLRLEGGRAWDARCPGAERLAAGRADTRACWVVGEQGNWVRRLAGDARSRGLFARPAARGGQAAALDEEGGLVLAAGGALLRLRSDGATAPGQGGFAHLSDLDRW
jgi:hypothetical protein